MLILLVMANIVVFALMAASTGEFAWSATTLYAWGGNLGVTSLHGQPWRLLTALFLHAGISHIVGNMLLLAITGSFVERKIGPAPMLAAYLACGLAASLASACTHPGTVSIGASGAIAGLLGIMVAFYASRRMPEIRGAWIAQTVGLNALYSFVPNVDWTAHAAGFVTGLAAGALLLKRHPLWRTG